MMINRKDYDYLPMDLPNIVSCVLKGNKEVHGWHPKMEPLVMALAKRKPNWMFVTEGGSGWVVYERNEELGSLSIVHHLSGTPYDIYSRTIRRGRRGTSGQRTADLKKAIKIVLSNFKALTHIEKAKQRSREIDAGIGGLWAQKRSKYLSAREEVYKFLDGYILANWDAISQEMLRLGEKPDKIAAFISASGESEEIGKIRVRQTSDKGYSVVILEGVYYVANGSTEDFREYQQDAVPDFIKRGLGMLKLIDDGTAVSNIGYRYKEDSFYVMGE